MQHYRHATYALVWSEAWGRRDFCSTTCANAMQPPRLRRLRMAGHTWYAVVSGTRAIFGAMRSHCAADICRALTDASPRLPCFRPCFRPCARQARKGASACCWSGADAPDCAYDKPRGTHGHAGVEESERKMSATQPRQSSRPIHASAGLQCGSDS
jgi:hypothetical protein